MKISRGVLLAVLSLAVFAGCNEKQKGNLTKAGALPEQVHDGDLAFEYDPAFYDYWMPHTIKQHDAAQVVFSDDPSRSWAVPLKDIIAAQNIQPGDLFSPHGEEVGVKDLDHDCDVDTILAVTSTGPGVISGTCGGKERTWPLKNISLPKAGLQKTLDARLGVSLAITLLGLIAFFFARIKKGAAADALAVALAELPEHRRHSAEASPAGPERMSVLRCPNCDETVPLAPATATKCRACGTSVDIPPDYVKLVEARTQKTLNLAAAASSLARARLVTSPITAGVVAVIAIAVWMGQARMGLPFVPGFALRMIALLTAITAVLVVSFGRGRLNSLMRPLYAPAAKGGGYGCRACGAALGTDTDGIAVCDYCHAQNLIDARLAEFATEAQSEVKALRSTIAIAAATYWAALWRALGTPLMILGGLTFLVSALLSIAFLVIAL